MKTRLSLVVLLVFILFGCGSVNKHQNKAKYVFLFIGDGMGIQQVNTASVYADSVLKDSSGISFTKFPIVSFSTTYAANRYITCSAAAGTALSTGYKTSIGTLGLNANHTDTLFSIAKKFKEQGKKVAILTSVSIDHATPAAFYAHKGSRSSYYEIAQDLIKSNYDFFASGGFLEPYGSKNDSVAVSVYKLGAQRGISFTSSFAGIDSLKLISNSKIVYSAPNPDEGSSLQYEIDRSADDISLADMTQKAIEVVDNPNGFFMMVEGGKIDWACHDNDAATAIHDVLALSDAVSVAVQFYNEHPNETLIIVTADHETGGMSLGNNPNKYDNHLVLLRGQKMSLEKLHNLFMGIKKDTPKASFNEILVQIQNVTGLSTSGDYALTTEELSKLKNAYSVLFSNDKNSTEHSTYSSIDPLSKEIISILNLKSGVGWTSSSHTGSPVPVFVLGEGSNLFEPFLDNTDIPKNILRAAAIN